MIINSRPVTSNQSEVHPDLDFIVTKHLLTKFKKPITDFNKTAFLKANHYYHQYKKNFILDSGCGVGESTYHIAINHPDAFVIGIDQSEHRINSQNHWQLPENALLLRADLVDFWRLAVAENWQLAKHFLLYPNPWPKKKHFKRRWHGHPIFSVLKALGGEIDLRTNWKVYADEYSLAINHLMKSNTKVDVWKPDSAISPFERKYLHCNQTLYRVFYCSSNKTD